jgi:hypothetical protein
MVPSIGLAVSPSSACCVWCQLATDYVNSGDHLCLEIGQLMPMSAMRLQVRILLNTSRTGKTRGGSWAYRKLIYLYLAG